MRRKELTIFLALAVIGLLVAFWLVILSPKRNEAASLKKDVDSLHSSLEQAQQAATAGEQARKSFPVDYRKLVVLGKAVPEDGEQASLLVQLQSLADGAGVDFQSIDLAGSSSAAPAGSTESSAVASTEPSSSTPAASSSTSSSSSSTPSASSTPASSSPSSSSTPPAAPVAATEASVATLPIGASVGPAGLPVMPYDLKFTGGFFQIADFLNSLDGMVHLRRGAVSVDGRLLTVDAFSLEPVQSQTGPVTPVPQLSADLAVTTYLTPADQGIAAGATPTGPAPATATPAASTTPAPAATSTPTASTSP